MRLINIIQTLQSEGHKITYRVRSDGGLIIKSIDGKKFSSLTEGNRLARSMVVGGELSASQFVQTRYNVENYIKLKKDERKAKGSIDEALNQKLKQVQRIWRKNKVIGQGHISKKKLRWYIKTEGVEGAMDYLEGRIRYGMGYANEENIYFLLKRIKKLHKVDERGGNPKYTDKIDKLINDIESMKDIFREEWIEPIHKILGTSEGKVIHKAEIEQIIKEIRIIIGKPE